MDLAAALVWMALQLAELQRPRIAESVTVSGAPGDLATPSAVTTLGREALQASASLSLDDTLRSVPGFSLFRRSSSRVANPTTQGVTLRGLAASGSSRALVLADGVPLNDPVGGWVYWNRVPIAALSEVAIMRGAAGDLLGADALAGVIAVRSANDRASRLLLDAGSARSARLSVYSGGARLFGSGELFSTDGFVIVAPESRGVVDTPAASKHAAATGASVFQPAGSVVWLRGAAATESRRNGTPLQRNATDGAQLSARVLRQASARTGWSADGYVLSQAYEQTFSAVGSGRLTERLTSEQNVKAVALGATGRFYRSYSRGTLAFAASGRHVDATLVEGPPGDTPRRVSAAQSTVALSARGQVDAGAVSAGSAVRAEVWRSAHAVARQQTFLNPRAWITVRPARTHTLFSASVQSGYRAPTTNELHRPFRVGSVLTEANPSLRPERVLGFELGASRAHRGISVRAVGFWSRVDDAIVNVTLDASDALIVRQRQNAARIHASGFEAEADVRVRRWLTVTGSTAYTRSTFESGPLEGLRVPQVARLQYAFGVRGTPARLRFAIDGRYIGAQYDDDRNAFELDPSFALDARAGWILRRGTELFAAVENALDEEQDVGRTPLRTIGLPRTARLGVRIQF